MYYWITDTLVPCKASDCRSKGHPYVANISMEEFEQNRKIFNMGIDLDFDEAYMGATQIEVNYDSLTGSFAIPDKATWKQHCFYFALDERGIVFLNDDGYAQRIIEQIMYSRKWKRPSLERFIYDFMEMLLKGDMTRLKEYEREMDAMEDKILEDDTEGVMERLVDIRSELLDLHNYYDELIDFAQELEENENNFFEDDNLRFFHLFSERVSRMQNIVTALRDHTLQVRDLHRAQIEAKQSSNMTILTVVATIFMPLTLITGWYGMNFTYMPELSKPWGYPVLVAVCLTIAIGSIIYFKRRKLL